LPQRHFVGAEGGPVEALERSMAEPRPAQLPPYDLRMSNPIQSQRQKYALAIPVMAVLVLTIVSLLLLEIALQTFFYFKNGYWLFTGQNRISVDYVKSVADRRQYSLKDGVVTDRSEKK
jgi:hypothetical protein